MSGRRREPKHGWARPRADRGINSTDEEGGGASVRRSVVGPRLYLGFVVLVGAEICSGSSAGPKLLGWWTWCVVYWLYFLHFFLFANLAVRTRRTSLRAVYLWGVLYGLYEGPLAKVIWAGFRSQGEFALAGDGFSGQLLGHGLMEMSMVLLWDPFASFLPPLCAATLLMPELRDLFPGVERLLCGSRCARRARAYVAATFALTLPAVLALTYGSAVTPAYVALSWAVVLSLLVLGYRCLAQGMRQPGMGSRVVVLQRRGYVLTWLFFALMYVLFDFGLFPQALPPVKVQVLTLWLYLVTGLAIWRTPSVELAPEGTAVDAPHPEWRRMRWECTGVVAGSIVLAFPMLVPPAAGAMRAAFMANALLWTLLAPALFLLGVFPRRLRVSPQRES
jgi:hypothetical protein